MDTDFDLCNWIKEKKDMTVQLHEIQHKCKIGHHDPMFDVENNSYEYIDPDQKDDDE